MKANTTDNAVQYGATSTLHPVCLNKSVTTPLHRYGYYLTLANEKSLSNHSYNIANKFVLNLPKTQTMETILAGTSRRSTTHRRAGA